MRQVFEGWQNAERFVSQRPGAVMGRSRKPAPTLRASVWSTENARRGDHEQVRRRGRNADIVGARIRVSTEKSRHPDGSRVPAEASPGSRRAGTEAGSRRFTARSGSADYRVPKTVAGNLHSGKSVQ